MDEYVHVSLNMRTRAIERGEEVSKHLEEAM